MEKIIGFETAKLLKEKGFPQCKKEEQYAGLKYNMDGELTHAPFAEHYRAVTQSEVMHWIRDNYAIHISPYFTSIGWYYEIFDLTRCDITGCEPFYRVGIPSSEQTGTYEETVENAIKHTLEHLI